MTISLAELTARIKPNSTALLLGAGASVPSGAPSGVDLARRLWTEVVGGSPQSDDLIETASIIERRYSRRAVTDVVRSALTRLRPTGGLLALPALGWDKIYTTNFDRLLEKAFKVHGLSSVVYRSNFDFTAKESAHGTRIYKIHGCVSQDRAYDNRSSMTLTETDYEEHQKYRQALFATLTASMLTQDVLVIGQSLRDRHLVDLVRYVLSLRTQGVPGRVFVLVYDKDELRVPLLEDRGAIVAFGTIDELVAAFVAGGAVAVAAPAATVPANSILPLHLLASTVDVAAAVRAPSNVRRMFNGGAATYADIAQQVTFERALFASYLDGIRRGTHPAFVVEGAAGVGKTTLARQLLHACHENGVLAWEHKADFTFEYRAWLDVERDLRQRGVRGVIFVDECTHYLRSINALVEALADTADCALTVVLTANSAQWAPRIKSRIFFTKCRVERMSVLAPSEIQSLINLVDHNRMVADMVHEKFKRLSRSDKTTALTRRALSDMFVCLNNIFETKNLDTILLEEYDELDPDVQEYYRYVAALEAVGTEVHRQLVIRMLNLSADQVAATLHRLSGIVDEIVIREKDGIYGWNTRHIVIARKIAEYKFSTVDDLTRLFRTIVDNLNPSEPSELRTIRNLCDVEYGIGRLGDSAVKMDLYRRLIAIAPGERIPWHRLIRELLDAGELDDVEYEIRAAEKAVNADAPIDRYKVRLLIKRSKQNARISDADRAALLRRAYELAMANIDRHKLDKFTYYTLCDVSLELMDRGESEYYLEEALAKLREAAEVIRDPEMSEKIGQYERQRARRRR